jgi:hypothetical protein
MGNHFHLHLRTPVPNLSSGMHDLNSGYASAFNRRHRRCGSLFQGRFKAILVENESYSLELTRYIHLNPVRARVVERAEDYYWSSYQDYLARRKTPPWLDWETVVGRLARSRSRARSTYQRFVEAGLSEPSRSPLAAAVGGMFLGTNHWVDRWRRHLSEEPPRDGVPVHRRLAWRPTLHDIVAVVSEAFDVEPTKLLKSRRHGNEGRSAAIYLARSLTDEPLSAIGECFGGVSPAAISKTVARAESRCREDFQWERRLTTLRKRLLTSGSPLEK